MRISDCSSVVCSSDLRHPAVLPLLTATLGTGRTFLGRQGGDQVLVARDPAHDPQFLADLGQAIAADPTPDPLVLVMDSPVQTLDLERAARAQVHRLPGRLTLRGIPAVPVFDARGLVRGRSEEHTSELQSLMRHSY